MNHVNIGNRSLVYMSKCRETKSTRQVATHGEAMKNYERIHTSWVCEKRANLKEQLLFA